MLHSIVLFYGSCVWFNCFKILKKYSAGHPFIGNVYKKRYLIFYGAYLDGNNPSLATVHIEGHG
mgnify:CR=1 FL=1